MKLKNITKIASSGTKEGIVNCLNKFFCSTTYSIDFETGIISNSKGVFDKVKIMWKKNRYILFYD